MSAPLGSSADRIDMKKLLALASVALLAGSLTACGGDDSSAGGGGGGGSYCDQVKDLKSNVDDLDFATLTEDQFADLQSALDGIASSAPDDVKDDWTTVGDAIDEFKSILTEAGISLDDLQAIQDDPSNLPDGVDIAKLQELAQKLNDFSANSDFADASDAVQQSVKNECGVDLDTSSTTGS
jgi:hypothetical protein